MCGWIKIHRQILEWEWYDDSNMFHLWIHLLLKATPADREWHGGILRRGQLVTTVAELAEETGMTVRNVRTCLARLIQQANEKQIEVKTTNRKTIITICNYDRYQCQEEGERQTNDKQTTNERQTEQRKEESNKEEVENIIRIEKERISKDIPKKESLSLHNNNPDGYENYDFSFVDENMREVFYQWLAYKRERKEKYKSQASLKVCYKHLVEYSDGNPAKAKKVIEHSMANNYMGLFELKEQQHGTNRRYYTDAAQRTAQAANDIATFILDDD